MSCRQSSHIVFNSQFSILHRPQSKNEWNQLSEWSVSILCGYTKSCILFESKQRRSTRFDGEEITLLCPIHCGVSAAEEDEIGARIDCRVGQTSTGIYIHVSYAIASSIRIRIWNLKKKSIFTWFSSYEPEDQLEWSLVLEEIRGFIKAESAVAVLHADSNPIVLSHRWVNCLSSRWCVATVERPCFRDKRIGKRIELNWPSMKKRNKKKKRKNSSEILSNLHTNTPSLQMSTHPNSSRNTNSSSIHRHSFPRNPIKIRNASEDQNWISNNTLVMKLDESKIFHFPFCQFFKKSKCLSVWPVVVP